MNASQDSHHVELSIAEIVPQRIREARAAHSWTQSDLADQLSRVGITIDRAVIARIEKRQRKIRLDEFIAFAAALDVSPVFLLSPRPELDHDRIRLSPGAVFDADDVWNWIRGIQPLGDNHRVFEFMRP